MILIHGLKASKDWGFFPWLAEMLCDQEMAVCRFNMSRQEDLMPVVRHCQTRVALPTFLLGHAEGADTAMACAPDVPNIRGVVAWSASAVDASSLSVPLLLINSADIAARDVSRVTIAGADRDFSKPRELELAAAVSARFISAYS